MKPRFSRHCFGHPHPNSRGEGVRRSPVSTLLYEATIFALLAGSCFTPLCAKEPIHSLSVTPLRDYGILMGEIVSSEIRVTVASGFALETATLALAGSAVNDFLEVRESSWGQQASPGETEYRIRLVYQVFKGVREAETLEVPALPLRFSRGAESVEAMAPAWKFTIMPMIPPQTPDEDVAVQGDLPLPAYSASNHWRWLSGFLAALAGLAGLAGYAAWRMGLPPFRFKVSPFKRAAFGLKKLGKNPDDRNWMKGVRLIHDGLNETAGHILFSDHLTDFLRERPEYAELETELKQFFAVSERLFFSVTTAAPADFPWARLQALCRKLAAAGKGK